jgi:hypothetical protein
MVTWQEVEQTLGRTLTNPQRQQAAMWIGQALTIIEARAVRENTTAAALDQHVLDMVVTEAVADRFRYPDDATQITVQVDDGQVSRRYESATGQIRIRDEWWNMLFPTNTGGAFTIRLDRPHRHPGSHHAW